MIPVELTYSPSSPSGLLWKVDIGTRAKAGTPAGSRRKDGYWTVKINGAVWKAHRLVVMLCYPTTDLTGKVIDHIDGNKSNNHIDNLKVCSSRTNQQNRYGHRAGKLVGAIYDNRRGRWRSVIVHNKQQRFLGYWDTEQQAHTAYNAALMALKDTYGVGFK